MSYPYYPYPEHPAYPAQPTPVAQPAQMAQPAPPGYPPYPAYAYPAPSSGFLGLGSDALLKGVLVGAAVTLLVSNEPLQRAVIKTAVRGWNMVQGGFEEVKERFHDAQEEVRAEHEGD
jgi:hypothetical protein